MKKIIIGLGNPGFEYAQTRHNAGFMFLDFLQEEFGLNSFSEKQKHKASLSLNHGFVLVKPLTYMNLSGEAVASVLRYYNETADNAAKIVQQQILVAHDDLDIELGEYKVQFGVGPRDHRGLLSIYQHLDTNQFWHIRIGVDGRRGSRLIPADRYVLQQFSTDSLDLLQSVFNKIVENLRQKELFINQS